MQVNIVFLGIVCVYPSVSITIIAAVVTRIFMSPSLHLTRQLCSLGLLRPEQLCSVVEDKQRKRHAAVHFPTSHLPCSSGSLARSYLNDVTDFLAPLSRRRVSSKNNSDHAVLDEKRFPN